MSVEPKIIFLHIPKTAGQSVHAALENAYGSDAVCPARVNEQLRRFTIKELNRYKVFSGHLDWSMLDCIQGPKYVFTVLREPMDRILSFYFYLKDEAAKLAPAARERPEYEGMKAVLEFSPRQYFVDGPPSMRRFLDDHYDNFYTYFFAGRHYGARGPLVGAVRRGDLDRDRLLDMARDNLSCLNDVFTVNRMADVFAMIRRLSGKGLPADDTYRVNVNTKLAAEDRMARLQALGADEPTMQRLRDFCSLDNALWNRFDAQVAGERLAA